MFPSAQPSTVVPLHNRNLPGQTAAVDEKEAALAGSRPSTSSPPPVNAADGVHDLYAVTSAGVAIGSAQSSAAMSATITPMMRTRDRICFRHLLLGAAASAMTLLLLVWVVWRATAQTSLDPIKGKVVPYTFQYFVYCFLGGIVAGFVHLVVTPIDVVKCRVQVGEYRSFQDGFVHLYRVEADGSLVKALPLFFRGWVPTAWGYCVQGSLKFSLYEVFKYVLLVAPLARRHAERASAGSRGPSVSPADGGSVYDSAVFQLLMFLLASSLAEVIADLGLAPWEAVKIRMQTSSTFPTSLRTALPRMWETEGLHGFYKGLVPLWCRQVPYTMMKFASFEMIVVSLASMLQAMQLLDPQHPSTLGKLIVSLMAGMLAGVLCGLVSHPADTVLSKMNQKSNAAAAGSGPSTSAPLLATAIAAARNGSMGGSAGGGSSGTLHDIVGVVYELGWKGVWKGLAPRLLMVSTLTALQWVAYDGFKVFVGLPTSGGVVHK